MKSTHTLALRHVSICGVSPSYSSYSSSYATCWMLVHAYATSPEKAKRSGPHHIIKMLHFVLFRSFTCYTNSMVPHIHVNSTKLQNITCTLVAAGVILWSLECIQTIRSHASRCHQCNNGHYCIVDFVLLHNVTCYTISLLSRIQVTTTQLLHITCALVATSVILRSLECICLCCQYIHNVKYVNIYIERN